MSKALVEQFCRAQELQDTFLLRCQREFRRDVLPIYDEIATLRAENASLKQQLAKQQAKSKDVA